MSGDRFALDTLYSYMVRATSDPDRFEFGDEVMDTVELKARPYFARSLNAIMATVGLDHQVRLLKDIEGNAEDKRSEQTSDFLAALNALFEKVRGEPTVLRTIIPQEWVEKEQEDLLARYKGMQEEYYGLPQPMELTKDSVVSWDKTHLDLLESPTMLDDLVRFGGTLIKDIDDVWRISILAQASCFSPGIMQGEKEHRSQIHVLLVGEYSTSKSGLVGYMSKMFPKVVRCSDTTGVGLMGSVNRKGEKVMGLAEEADGSVLVLDEIEKMLKATKKMDAILRIIMEDQYFSRRTAFGELSYRTKPSIFGMANPKNDVFYSNESLASQVPFNKGLLSRFDYLRTLAYSKDKINGIAEFIAKTSFKSFEEQGHMTTRDVLRTFYALRSSLRELKVEQVGAEESLLMDVHDRFMRLQKEVEGVPLLSVRDFMSSMRVLNASVVLHHKQRVLRDGMVMASEQDRDNAIYILDNSVKMRETLLASCKRTDVTMSPVDRAYGHVLSLVQRQGSVSKQEAVDLLQHTMGIGQATAYKWLNQMVGRGMEIRQEGQRNAVLVPA